MGAQVEVPALVQQEDPALGAQVQQKDPLMERVVLEKDNQGRGSQRHQQHSLVPP